MKRFILLSLFLLVGQLSAVPYQSSKVEDVYICTGPKSKCYHKTNHCQGLDRCSKEVIKVTKAYAISKDRTPCKWCYPKKKK